MAADVDAVIAALRVVIDEAQKSSEDQIKVETANRWISHLPGSWTGRWRKLILKGDTFGDADREEFAGHVRAVIAFLEANRSHIPAPRKWWSLRRRNQPAPVIVAAPVAAPTSPPRPANLLRVRKPMPGVH
jgi:hypothetical protein